MLHECVDYLTSLMLGDYHLYAVDCVYLNLQEQVRYVLSTLRRYTTVHLEEPIDIFKDGLLEGYSRGIKVSFHGSRYNASAPTNAINQHA